MKTRTLLMGWVLSPWLICAAQAEEPPDDTIVQETVASHVWMQLDGNNNLGGNIVQALIQAEVYVKAERLSRSGVTVYEINRKLPGTANAFDSLPGGSGGMNLPVSELAESIEVTEVPDPSRRSGKTWVTRAIPPDRALKMRLEAGVFSATQMAAMARAQAAGALVVGAVLQDRVKDSPFGSLMTGGAGQHLTALAAIREAPGQPACSGLLHVLGTAQASAAWKLNLTEAIEPWTSINPMTFMTSQACFLLVGAEALEALGKLPPEAASQIASAIERSLQSSTYGGTETVDGRPTHKIAVVEVGGQLPGGGQPAAGNQPPTSGQQATGSQPPDRVQGISDTRQPANTEPQPAGLLPAAATPDSAAPPLSSGQQSAGDPQMEIKALYRWIDAEYFVPRKLRIEGVMHAEGQSREFFLEKLEQDYRNVPNSHLYEPYRTVLRMGGMLTPSQEAEMRESQGKLDELERRLASMSPAERALTTRMMGDKIEQWRSLANGGAVEFEIITTSIVINPDLSASGVSVMPPEEPAPATPTALSPEELRAAQLACLQERAAAAQQAQKKKRGLGRLTSAVTRTAAMLGDSSIGRVAGDLFSAGQSADDLVAAARDLGLTEDDAAACQQP